METDWARIENKTIHLHSEKYIVTKEPVEFDEYWKIQDSHGHTGETIAHQAEVALKKINADDEHTRWKKFGNKMVHIGKFKFRLVDLKSQGKKHFDSRLYSKDTTMKVEKYVDKWGTGEYISDGEEMPTDLKIIR
jgi:hypothetical protein